MKAPIRRSMALVGIAFGFGLMAAHGHADEPGGGDAFAKVGVYGGDELARMRAGDGDVTTTVANMQTLQVTSEGNSFDVGEMTNGAVTVGGSALHGFRGVGNFVFTTGNGNTVSAPVSVIIMLE